MDFVAVYKNVIKPLHMYCEALFQKSERLKKQVEELQVQLEACRKQSKATKEMDSKLCTMIKESIDMEKYDIINHNSVCVWTEYCNVIMYVNFVDLNYKMCADSAEKIVIVI